MCGGSRPPPKASVAPALAAASAASIASLDEFKVPAKEKAELVQIAVSAVGGRVERPGSDCEGGGVAAEWWAVNLAPEGLYKGSQGRWPGVSPDKPWVSCHTNGLALKGRHKGR